MLYSRLNGCLQSIERFSGLKGLNGIAHGVVGVAFILSISSAAWALSDGIAAIVNDEVITQSELQAELKDEVIRLKARFNGKELSQRIRNKQYTTLNYLIERRLQLQEAKSKGFEISDAEMQKSLERIKKAQGASMPSNEQIREELTLMRLRDFEVRQHIMVATDEIRDYYQKNQTLFRVPPQYRLRQILLLPKSGESMSQVQARAQSIFSEIKKGGKFSDLAARYSDGREAIQGEGLGFFRKDELLAPLGKALENMQVGEISAPLETKLGIHIIILDEAKHPKARALEEVESQIRQMLYDKKVDAAYQAWLSGLKNKAYIEINF